MGPRRGNSLGELRWEGARGWTDGKPWEIAWGELVRGSGILRSRAAGMSFQGKFHQFDCREKLCAQNFSSGLQTLGHAELRWQGATLKMHSCWHGFFRTNFINTIVLKNCAPKTCQSFQTLGHGTCIASLSGSESKRGQIPSTRLSPK